MKKKSKSCDFVFERFTSKRKSKSSTTPMISIGSRKLFTFNKAFFEKFIKDNDSSKKDYVSLLFNKETNSILFQFFNNNNDKEYCFKVNKVSSSDTRMFIARSFFNYFNIDSEKYSGRYFAKEVAIKETGDNQVKLDVKGNTSNLAVIYLDEKVNQS